MSPQYWVSSIGGDISLWQKERGLDGASPLDKDYKQKRGACYYFVARTPERQKLFYRISLVNAVCVKVGQVLS